MTKTPSDSLIRLRQLTPTLPIPLFHEFVDNDDDSNYKELIVEHGLGFGFNLFSLTGKISVARWYMTAGTILPIHSHEEMETIVVYQGSLTITLWDNDINKKEDICLYPGVCYYLEPNTPHSAYCTEDCWAVAITIPSSEDWPNG